MDQTLLQMIIKKLDKLDEKVESLLEKENKRSGAIVVISVISSIAVTIFVNFIK